MARRTQRSPGGGTGVSSSSKLSRWIALAGWYTTPNEKMSVARISVQFVEEMDRLPFRIVHTLRRARRGLLGLLFLLLMAFAGCAGGANRASPSPGAVETRSATLRPRRPVATFSPTPDLSRQPVITPWPTATPSSWPALQAADALFETGDLSGAEAAYKALLADLPPDVTAGAVQYRLGKLLFVAGRWAEAAAALQDAAADTDLPPERYFWLARTWQAADRPEKAIAAYRAYMQLSPALRDAAAKRLAALYAGQGDLPTAFAWYQRALAAAPTLSEKLALREQMAAFWSAQGIDYLAVDQYTQILTAAQKPAYRAKILRLRGNAQAAGRNLDGAAADWRAAVREAPHSREAYLALIQLVNDKLPVDDLLRARIDSEQNAWVPARAALEHYLGGNPSVQNRLAAECLLGQALSALGDQAGAVKVWTRVEKEAGAGSVCWGKAEIALAGLAWQSGANSTALSLLQNAVAAYPAAAWAGEASWQLAVWQKARGEMLPAIEAYIAAARTLPDDRRYRAAVLSAANAWAARRPALVIPLLQEQLAEDGLPDAWRAPFRYWLGKLQLLAGEQGAAKTTWAQLQAEAPDSYYAWRLVTAEHWPPPRTCSMDSVSAERVELIHWLRHWQPDLQPAELAGLPMTLTGSAAWQRAEAWREAGFVASAESAYRPIITETKDPVLLYRLAIYFHQCHAYALSIAAVNQLAMFQPVLPCALWRLRYPTPWQAQFLSAAAAEAVSPSLLYAVAHQESHFTAAAYSSVGAIGVMQIMPATAQWLAPRMGWRDFSLDLLRRPGKSVQMGAFYLHWLAGYLPGDLPAQLVGYNAGPGNARHWRDQFGPDDDLFLEQIPVQESRHYLRQVLRNMAAYKMLYAPWP